jgi:hypothetical protein
VDIRLISNNPDPDLGTLRNSLDHSIPRRVWLELSDLQWAFAGNTIVERLGTEDNPTTKCRWDHELDSRIGPNDRPEEDSGEMSRLSDGSVLERGWMKNEAGLFEDYEELWRDLPIENSYPPGCQRTCVVAVLHHVHFGMRGMMIRIGAWIQCIVLLNAADGSSDRYDVNVDRYKWDPLLNAFLPLFYIGRYRAPFEFLLCDAPVGEACYEHDGNLIWRIAERHYYQ